jgi:signal transduction histidine kinase
MLENQHLEQPKLEKELARRTRRLSALYQVLSAYHQVDGLDEMMVLVLEQVLNISTARVGTIHLLDESGEILHLVAHKGINPSVMQALLTIPAKDPTVHNIITRKKPMIVTDMLAGTRLAEITRASGWQVYIGTPIAKGDKIWGVLAIFGNNDLQVSSEEIEMLEIIARQIGDAIDSSYLREQAERLAVVEERNRLARELHDSVTQSLYSLTLFAETGIRMMESGELAETRRCLVEIADSSQQALKEMRLLVYKLRPSTYTKGGLFATIEQRLRAVEGRSGIKFNFKADETLSLQPEAEGTLYAIAVEALNNALKYARAGEVRVTLARQGDFITLEISDNGSGFDVDRARQSGGLGLTSIEERTAHLGGTLTIDSAPGLGTTIGVRIPNPGSR